RQSPTKPQRLEAKGAIGLVFGAVMYRAWVTWDMCLTAQRRCVVEGVRRTLSYIHCGSCPRPLCATVPDSAAVSPSDTQRTDIHLDIEYWSHRSERTPPTSCTGKH